MNKRPASITAIAWISIIIGGLSLIATSFILYKQLINKSITTLPFDYLLIYLGSLIYIIAGIAILKAKNWARFLFLIWQIIYFTIRLVRIPLTTSMFLCVFIFLIVPAFFLFRPQANDFFAERVATRSAICKIITAPEERGGGGRKVISVICYVISGTFFYIAAALSFLNEPWIYFKTALLGVFGLLALLFLIIGLISSRFQNWYLHVGLVCTWAAGFTIFEVFIMWFLMNDPKFAKAFPPDFPGMFSSFFSGFVCLAILGSIGILFLMISRKKGQPFSGPDGDSDDLVSRSVS